MTADAAQQTIRVYQLKIVLRDISPLVWRRVRVTSDTTIADLHAIVQTVMGWEDVHLHQFRIHGKAYGVYRGGGVTFADNPRQVRLADFRLHTGERFLYEYDFGDGWQHDIRLEQVVPLDEHTLLSGLHRWAWRLSAGGLRRALRVRRVAQGARILAGHG